MKKEKKLKAYLLKTIVKSQYCKKQNGIFLKRIETLINVSFPYSQREILLEVMTIIYKNCYGYEIPEDTLVKKFSVKELNQRLHIKGIPLKIIFTKEGCCLVEYYKKISRYNKYKVHTTNFIN